MTKKAEQGDATRRQLVGAAIALFTAHGYADTSTTRIVEAAGVTRGALYHHFPDKEHLFEAAYLALQADVHARCAAAAEAADGDRVTRMMAGMDAFLTACLEKPVQRILLLEGPLVLGWERSVRFDDPYCARQLLRAGLAAAARSGILPAEQAEPLTHLLYGALHQAGVSIAAAADPTAQRSVMSKVVGDLVTARLRGNGDDGTGHRATP
ncbi:TetR/AcrR family transcriptional regulator [Kitasatospora sp. NBC_00240]|uniref:TetR/AcrR family transcriptional regulator n=1 Tax=Kitasatospora sp. NBC_00240 TaxID=2903567 RepID=UPI00225379F2|nr:TetR/AcrR family transcriptional regulator [Kitasatospora sp. NBC_00240]MCX5208644.1 TetR/AcrR family transcriptional regulator [Kitasatospora sp. NBC_00240]